MITVGSASSLEQRLLGQLTTLVLEDAGFRVKDRSDLGTGSRVRRAIEAEEVDLCWDYTATAWALYLGHDRPLADPHELYERMRTEDNLNAITWMPPAPARGEMGLIVTSHWASEQGIFSLDQLAQYINHVNPHVRICAPEESMISSGGIRGLEQVYGFRFAPEQVIYGSFGDGYQSLANGECDCALGRLIDAGTATREVLMLSDLQSYYPPSSLCLAIRSVTLLDNPTIEAPLRSLSSALTTGALMEMQQQIVIDEQDTKVVAKRFLKEQELVGK